MESVPVRNNGSSKVDRHTDNKHKKRNPKTLLATVILAAALLILLLGGWLVVTRSGAASSIDSGKYQAVFLTNGQVYFGKLQMLSDGYVKLTDIYYLQDRSSEDRAGNPQKTEPQDASDVQLIKLGSEIHGPEDEMVISEDKLLFFENLKDDGKVSTSIRNYHGQE